MNRPKIAIFDLDGTLTNSKKELTDRNRQAIIALQQLGIKVVLASGRPTYGIMPLANTLELARYGGYILSYNGGVIIDCANNCEIYSNVLPDNIIEPLHRESKAAGCVILSYDNEFIITEDASDKYVGVEAHLNKMEVKEVENFVEAFHEPLPKCLSVGEPERVIELETKLKGMFGDVINIYRSEPFFLELVPPKIDKAHSLEILIEKLGMTSDDMVAFGDGFNDLSMIQFAGTGVAMANAQDVVKEHAQAITSSNDEDGVAEYIENHIL